MKYIFVLLATLAIACSKFKDCGNRGEFVNAVVIDAGVEAADGCGWMIKIDTKFYHPENLETSFRENNLPVRLTYQNLPDSFHCGVAPIGRPSIKILNITKQ